jgi:hypothetical protein
MDTQNLPSWLPYAIAALAIWTIPWKGIALWKAAKKEDKIWFIVLLVVNTAAILEILYIFLFSRDKESPVENTPEKILDKKEESVTDVPIQQ